MTPRLWLSRMSSAESCAIRRLGHRNLDAQLVGVVALDDEPGAVASTTLARTPLDVDETSIATHVRPEG